MLSDAAKADIRDALTAWRATFTLPVPAEWVRASIDPVARGLVAKYGIEALHELHRAVSELIGGQTPAQAWLTEEARQLRARPR